MIWGLVFESSTPEAKLPFLFMNLTVCDICAIRVGLMMIVCFTQYLKQKIELQILFFVSFLDFEAKTAA